LITGSVYPAPPGGFLIDYVVCMVPAQATTSETSATLVNEDSALYANAAADTDTIIRPTAGGATVVNSLRGPNAPSSFQWKVGTPAGDTLVALSNGGIAIVNPSADPDGDLTVPQRPPNAEDPQAIPDAATQLAEKRYQVAKAEEETGHAVLAVITHAIDGAGESVPASLSLTSADTVAVNSVAGAKALVFSLADDQDKLSPPERVNAFPVRAGPAGDLQEVHG
jgi:hypothetical protein